MEELNFDVVLRDDGRARHVAAREGIAHIGTVGLIVRVRNLGLIPAAAPLLHEPKGMGFSITDALLQHVAAQE